MINGVWYRLIAQNDGWFRLVKSPVSAASWVALPSRTHYLHSAIARLV